ncbi:MAG: SufE family protein [Fimbriimonadales bacterium]
MKSKPIPSALQERIDLFSTLPRSDRIEALISIAEKFKQAPPEIAPRPYDEANRVPGCESEAFVWVRDRADGTLDYYFAVENPQGVSAKALSAILGETVSGAPLEEVANIEDGIVYQFFGDELSMGKSMGLTSLVGMVRGEAKKRHTP